MTGAELIGPIQGTGADMVPPSLDRAREFARHSKAQNTLRGYRSDWRDFCGWCEARGLCPVPASPETVAAYIAECAGRLKVGTIQRRLNAIAEAHKAMGLESPTHSAIVVNTMKGIRRTKGTAPAQKAPTLIDDIRAMVDAVDAGLIGARDRALILLGFAGAFRRSELVGLNVEDCVFAKDGLTVTLRRSKTDQEGAGRKVGIPFGSNPATCPVRTVQAWIENAGIVAGPVFRSIHRHGRIQTGRLTAKTILRWQKEPEFDAAFRAAKRAAFGQSIGRLHYLSSAAVSTLGKVMLDAATPPATKVRAADSILNHTTKAIEIEDIEARVAELERVTEASKK